MNILPDPILTAIQAVPFAITLGGLHVIIFKPMLAYLGERDEAIDGAIDAAHALQEKATAKLDEYEAQVKAARAEASAHRTALYKAAKVEHAEVVSATRAEADTKISAAIAEIDTAAKAARIGLQTSAQTLASDVVERLLGGVAAS